MRGFRLHLALLVFAFAPACAFAANWGALLVGGPAQYFNGDDMKLFVDSAEAALNEAPKDKPVAWSNPKTRSSGAATVVEVRTEGGQQCKTLRIETQAKGLKEAMRYVACRQPDGEWRLVGVK